MAQRNPNQEQSGNRSHVTDGKEGAAPRQNHEGKNAADFTQGQGAKSDDSSCGCSATGGATSGAESTAETPKRKGDQFDPAAPNGVDPALEKYDQRERDEQPGRSDPSGQQTSSSDQNAATAVNEEDTSEHPTDEDAAANPRTPGRNAGDTRPM